MRVALPCAFCLALVACTPGTPAGRIDALGEPIKIDPAKPPNGEQLIQLLLENQSLPLKGTDCTDGKDDPRLLQHRLVMMLGVLVDNPKGAVGLSSRCSPEPVELPDGAMPEPHTSKTAIKAWRCSLGASSTEGEVFIGSSIYVILTKDTWKIYPKRLNCL